MRVVLDSNVHVSAFVLAGGAASQLTASLLRGRATPVISRPIMAEVLGALARKFAADREQLARAARCTSTSRIRPVFRGEQATGWVRCAYYMRISNA